MGKPKIYASESIPRVVSDIQVVQLVNKTKIDYRDIMFVKQEANISDELLASWFNMTEKTFRNYKKKDAILNDILKEHLILLVSLCKHGKETFGSSELFATWLQKENFMLDGQEPMSFLKTISGIRHIEYRLTAIQHGDNV